MTTDENGYILVNDNRETNLPGVYAAGDILPREVHQIALTTSDGITAAIAAQKYVANEKYRLGLPLVTSRLQGRLAVKKQLAKRDVLLSDVEKKRIRQRFAKLTKEVTLLTFTREDNPKTKELRRLVQEIADMSDKITVSEGLEDKWQHLKLTRFPTLVLLNDQQQYTGIRFLGSPSGHELSSLVRAIYNVGSDGEEIEEALLHRIKALPKTEIAVCISMSCEYCPVMVAAAQRIAALNHQVEAQMVDLLLAKDLKKEKGIMNIPALIINDEKVVFGMKKIEEIISFIEEG